MQLIQEKSKCLLNSLYNNVAYFENTNFTVVDDFRRLTIPDIHNSDWKIFPIFRRLGNL